MLERIGDEFAQDQSAGNGRIDGDCDGFDIDRQFDCVERDTGSAKYSRDQALSIICKWYVSETAGLIQLFVNQRDCLHARNAFLQSVARATFVKAGQLQVDETRY